MTAISGKKFAPNQNKYFNLVVSDGVPIQKGRVYYEPDEDFYNSITKNELLKGIHEDIDAFFATK